VKFLRRLWLAWRYRKRIPNAETLKAIESIERGLTQKGTIDRGSFADCTDNDSMTITWGEKDGI